MKIYRTILILALTVPAVPLSAQDLPETPETPPETHQIEEVAVTGRRSVLSSGAERFTVYADNPLLRECGSAVDMLRRIARVRVSEDGSVSVLGAGGAVVIVDGRQMPGDQSLESISSAEIHKINIITNPSARYDAEGKAVIEIVTRKAGGKPWSVELTARGGKGDWWRGYAGVEATAQIKGFSAYAFYGYTPSKTTFSEQLTRDYTATAEPRHISNTMETVNRNRLNNYRLSLEYRVSEQHNVGLQASGQYNTIAGRTDDRNLLSHPGITEPELIAAIHNTDHRKEYTSFTGWYGYRSKTDRFSLNALFDVSLFDVAKHVAIAENGPLGESEKQTNDGVGIDIFSGKVDMTWQLGAGFGLELGAKGTYSRNHSISGFTSALNATTTDYKYDEQVWAAYAILGWKSERWQLEAGLRGEVSDMFAKTDHVIRDDTGFNLFPSASANFDMTEKWSLRADYAAHITRPVFEDLNPAITYIDSLSYSQGNPSLLPELSHSVSLKVVFMGFASIGASYTGLRNQQAWYIEQDAANPAVTRGSQRNIDRSDVVTVDLMLPYQNDRLTVYLSTGIIHTITNDKYTGIVGLKHPMWYCYAGIDWNLPWKLKFDASLGYYTKGVANIFNVEPMFRMDAGLSRRFARDRLGISLMWSDVFRSARMKSYTTMNNRYLRYGFYDDQSFVQLSVSFRINSPRSSYNSRSFTTDDVERIKGKN